MHLESFNRGDILFRIGDIGNKFYIVLAGHVGVALEFRNNDFKV
jgi:CRP-like cAMP-binding protein